MSEDNSDSPFEWVAKSADPTLNAKGEQTGVYDDDEDSGAALGDEDASEEDQCCGMRNPSKLARTYKQKNKPSGQAKTKKVPDDSDFQSEVPNLLDSPVDKEEKRKPVSPNFGMRLEDLREHLEEDIAPKSLDEYMSRCCSLRGWFRLLLCFIVFGGIYKLLSATVPTKQQFKIFKRRHYEGSKETIPSLDSWPLYTDSAYYKPDIDRIKYKDYGVVALARTVQRPGHYFLGILGTWFPMPYLAPRSEQVAATTKKKRKQPSKHAWGVCMAGRCVCVPQVKPSLDFSKCQNAVWKNTWTRTVGYGGFGLGFAVAYISGLYWEFAVSFRSFVNPLYWYSFLTAPFLIESPMSAFPTMILTGVLIDSIQHHIKTNFRLWAVFFAGSYFYALGTLIMLWIFYDWRTLRRSRVAGVFGALAAWMGFLSMVSDEAILSWSFGELTIPFSISARDLFIVMALLDVVGSASIARIGGLALAFGSGVVLHTFFIKPF